MNQKHIFKYLLAALWILMLLPLSCRDEQWKEHNKMSEEGVGKNLLEVIKENPDWSKFYEALEVTGYDKVLGQSGSFTVFAPDNSAWESVSMIDVATLRAIVAGQIAYGKRLSSEKSLYEPMQMLNTKVISYDEAEQSFNGAQIQSFDYLASNGVIHATNAFVKVKSNIWEYLTFEYAPYNQVKFLKSLSTVVMDALRSVELGVNAAGNPVYDTVWMNVNDFLKEIPLDSEDKLMTYVVLEDKGYDDLINKFRPFFKTKAFPYTGDRSMTELSVCRDFFFEGLVDITEHDTLTNVFGVKVPLNLNKEENIIDTYEASNGRVYVIKEANILYREKIKPVIIEGEDFNAADNTYVLKRYNSWASGMYDVHVCCRTAQRDTIWAFDTIKTELDSLIVHKKSVINGLDSFVISNRIFQPLDNSDVVQANVNNFRLEYIANVYSADYEIYYMAHDDIYSHYSNPQQVMCLEQKLFISMPEYAVLQKEGDLVANNYALKECFVGVNRAGPVAERQLTRLREWGLNKNQTLAFQKYGFDVLEVEYTGVMTMWLCNTTRSTTAREQGMMFLDYILLKPILPPND